MWVFISQKSQVILVVCICLREVGQVADRNFVYVSLLLDFELSIEWSESAILYVIAHAVSLDISSQASEIP